MPSSTTMPAQRGFGIHQIVQAASDHEFFDLLVPAMQNVTRSGQGAQFLESLARFVADREADIERICSDNHQQFMGSVNQLIQIRTGAVEVSTEMFAVGQSMQSSTHKLAEQKKALVGSRVIRQNINDATCALQDSLEVLRLSNHVHDLLLKKNHYAALRALDDLQNIHLREMNQYKLAEIIHDSGPATKKLIAEAVMNDLHTWLLRIRETSRFLGVVAFYNLEQRRSRQKERVARLPYLTNFKLNSAVEMVSEELDDFDVLDNDDVSVDFTPLFECLHIHAALSQTDKFRSEYATTRRQQKELLLPTSVNLIAPGGVSLNELLESIAGFAIVERETMRQVPELRSIDVVVELWDSMCKTAIVLISDALHEVTNAELLLKIKGTIALFIQTMRSWEYPVAALDAFLLTLFEKYADLLKGRFSDDFQEIVSTDDYMPMPINKLDEYDKVVNVSWYSPEKSREEINFPCVLPFSQMYPLCCIDIRNFLNQFYLFSDDHFQQPRIIDESLAEALDELLSTSVCQLLVERLNSQYLGQIVQILINLEHFEIACQELEPLLAAARSSTSAATKVTLLATKKFRDNKKTAEKRIFELVNSKIDDLIGTAEYDWLATSTEHETSSYMQTLTRYLSNIMNSVLLGLPTEIKELVYFDALSHAATSILSLPLSHEVKNINPNGVTALAQDVKYLTEFVETLGNPILRENLDELQQTVLLMQSDNSDEFYDIATRNKKYGRVDALNGPLLLEKLVPSTNVTLGSRTDKFQAISSRFGIKS